MTIVRQGGQLTVADLLAILHDLPGDMPVVVDGYEAGLDDVEIARDEVAFGCSSGGYLGRHELAEDCWCSEFYARRGALILRRWQPDRSHSATEATP